MLIKRKANDSFIQLATHGQHAPRLRSYVASAREGCINLTDVQWMCTHLLSHGEAFLTLNKGLSPGCLAGLQAEWFDLPD